MGYGNACMRALRVSRGAYLIGGGTLFPLAFPVAPTPQTWTHGLDPS